MLVLPNQRLSSKFSKSVLGFLFFLTFWNRPHTLIRIVLLLGWQINIPNLTIFPKDHDLGHLCFGNISKYLDILTLWIFFILVHFPFWPGYKQILHQLSCAPWQSRYDIHDFWRLSFVMLMNLVQWILHKTLNHLSQCHLGVRLFLCIYDILAPTLNSWNNKGPLMTRNELFCPYYLLHRSLLSCFWLSSAAVPEFSPVFPLFFHCCLCIWNFHCLRHRNEFVNETAVSHRIHPFRSDVTLMKDVYRSLNPWSCALVGINNTSKSCPTLPNIAVGLPTASYWFFARHRCWHRNFQLSSSGFLRAALWAWTLHRLVRRSVFLSIVWHSRVWVSRWPIFVLLSFWLHRTYASTYLAICRQDEKYFVFL